MMRHGALIRRAAACAGLAALVTAASPGSRAAAAPAPRLIQAAAKTHTDSQQKSWDVNPNTGQITCGTSNVFSGACLLRVNNSNISFSDRKMTRDGLNYVLATSVGPGLRVERRLTVDRFDAVVRYVDTFENTSSSPVTVNVQVYTTFNYRATGIHTDSGGRYTGALGPQDAGLLAISYHGRPSVLFFMAMPNARVKPTLAVNGMQNVWCTYQLTVRPKRKASIMHGLAQRSMQGVPSPGVLEREFKPFVSGRWLKRLPRSLRRTVVNAGRGKVDGAAGLAVLAELDVDRSTYDVLAFGKDTRLAGAASCLALTAETRYGTAELPLESVAAIVGGRCEFCSPMVILRDGHVLKGDLSAVGLEFALKCGTTVSLSPERVDRIMLQESENDGVKPEEVIGWVQTVDGEQLLLRDEKGPGATRIDLATPWGNRRVALNEITSVARTDGWSMAWHVELQDGSKFDAYLDSGTITFHTSRFGEVALEPARVRAIRRRESDQKAASIELSPTVPYAILSGDTILVGKLDVDEITIRCTGEPVSVAPEHIKRLYQQIDASRSSRDGLVFTAELWDNGVLAGLVAETSLPIRVGGRTWRCPVRDIVEINVPTPTVPESTRNSIAEAIRNLGHPEWQARQKATEELASHGYLAKAQMLAALRTARDAETKKRLRELLDRIDK